MNKVSNANIVVLGDQEGPSEDAADSLERTQTITFYKGFFFDKYHSDIVVNKPSGTEWIRRSLSQRAQTVIHEGLHLLLGGFTDELLGEINFRTEGKGQE